MFELTQAFISSSNDDRIEIESLKLKVATLESELKEEKGFMLGISIKYISLQSNDFEYVIKYVNST